LRVCQFRHFRTKGREYRPETLIIREGQAAHKGPPRKGTRRTAPAVTNQTARGTFDASASRMTARPLRQKPARVNEPHRPDLVDHPVRPDSAPIADATPDPAPPLDETAVPPLTDPDEPKGG
jgi:hypothetical protein